jgi:hypothetical protein
MDVFNHHLYEYKRGLRNLILLTTNNSRQDYIEKRLQKEQIAYVIQAVNGTKINVFFGHRFCIDVLKTFPDVPLNNLTDEQDFLLGIMLGYDRLEQCKRYLKRKESSELVEELIG